MTAYTAVSTIVPSLLLMYYFQKRDLYPEPAHLLWKTFLQQGSKFSRV